MFSVSPATPPQSPPIPVPSPRPSRSSADAAPPAPLDEAPSGANPLERFNASRLISHPRLRQAAPDDPPKPPDTIYRLKRHARLVEHHLADKIRANWAVYDGDVQSLPALIAYMNKERPGLDLHYADSTTALMDALDKAPKGFHLRFILKDHLARAGSYNCPVHYYAEFAESPGKPVSGWMLSQAASGPSGASSATFSRLLVDLAKNPRFAGMPLMPVNTYNQANSFDTVMFAAHAAWTAHDNESTFKALHAKALANAKEVKDFDIEADVRQPIFCPSYYHHQQTISGEPTKAANSNYMSIFHFRRQLLSGAVEMLQRTAYADRVAKRTTPSVPMRRSSAPANQS